MENLKPNSIKAKEDRPKVEKVVTESASIVKKKGFSKFVGEFIGEEVSDIRTHLVKDLVVPTIKDVILDTISMLLGVGKFSSSRSRTARTIGDRVSYGKYYEDPRNVRPTASATSKVFDTDEIIFGNRGDAEQVLDSLCEIIERYGVARVTDLYDLAGLSVDYTAGKYGWTSLRNAKVERVRDGFMLDLPRAVPIG